MKKEYNQKIKIGPVIVSILADRPFRIPNYRVYTPFLYEGDEIPTLTIRIRSDAPPKGRGKNLIGEFKQNWSFFDEGDTYRWELFEQINFKLKQVVVMNRDFSKADVYLIPPHYRIPKSPRTPWCIASTVENFLLWWFTSWAAEKVGGVLIHSSAICFDGEGSPGALFIGPSGAGKTTTARLCRDHAGATVLNDERTFIWKNEKGLQVSGTPWNGELQDASSVTAALSCVYLLKQDTVNRLDENMSASVFSQIMQQAFLPIWDPKRMDTVVEAITEMMENTSCGELHLKKEASTANYIKELLNQTVLELTTENV